MNVGLVVMMITEGETGVARGDEEMTMTIEEEKGAGIWTGHTAQVSITTMLMTDTEQKIGIAPTTDTNDLDPLYHLDTMIARLVDLIVMLPLLARPTDGNQLVRAMNGSESEHSVHEIQVVGPDRPYRISERHRPDTVRVRGMARQNVLRAELEHPHLKRERLMSQKKEKLKPLDLLLLQLNLKRRPRTPLVQGTSRGNSYVICIDPSMPIYTEHLLLSHWDIPILPLLRPPQLFRPHRLTLLLRRQKQVPRPWTKH